MMAIYVFSFRVRFVSVSCPFVSVRFRSFPILCVPSLHNISQSRNKNSFLSFFLSFFLPSFLPSSLLPSSQSSYKTPRSKAQKLHETN
ncbi:hypothetical protein EYC80_009648 [Monilinia laxa]|uniref:Uncharacterized protein n=1 Tax=Monilinia laxa TaxID=61186 RepID=A0A5N6JYT7_MONLA|nr:hypothetical protein EYC80_009648 [Monilinia laxa]